MTDGERARIEGRGVVLFDGVCGLCNRFVRFLLRRDAGGRLVFVPLESAFGREMLGRFGVATVPDGVGLVTGALTAGERIYFRSDAVGEALGVVGGGWRLLGRGIVLVPKAVREIVYGFVAANRYGAFGRFATCPVPTAEERGRILGVDE
jgi:predicted DCC family thiol-disulfide oxidoreductase YuxK